MKITTYYLEMHSDPGHRPAPPREGLTIAHAKDPSVSFYRYLYNAVGTDYNWTSRKKISDDKLAAILKDPQNELHVLYADGAPAGFAELTQARTDDVELIQFGLMPRFIGQGLGKYFLQWTINKVWSCKPKRFWLHTCTKDHPGALPNYLNAGFTVYKEEVTEIMTAEAKLKDLNITLPEPPGAVAAYVPWVRTGNLIITSGQLPWQDGKLAFAGKLGAEVNEEQGYQAARLCAINAVAQLKAATGDLERIKRIVRLEGNVHAATGFRGHPQVLNGASDLMNEVFGERGQHTRTALGINEMPLDAPVQLSVWAEVADELSSKGHVHASSIAHITLAAREVIKTQDFFADTLGWRPINRPNNIGIAAAWLEIAPGQELHLLQIPEYKPSPFEREFGRHIAINYPQAGFGELIQRLKQNGAEIIAPERETPFKRFFFKEPNGYVFEVVAAERKPET